MFELWTSCQFRQNQDIQQDCLLEIHDKFQVCFARLARSIRLHCMIPHNVGIRKNSVSFSSSGTCPVALSRKEMLPLAGDVSCMLAKPCYLARFFGIPVKMKRTLQCPTITMMVDRKSQEIWASASNIQRGCFEAFLKFKYRTFCNPNANIWKKAMRSLLLVL